MKTFLFALIASLFVTTTALQAAPPANTTAPSGVLIQTVVAGSPAAHVGLLPGDRIVSIDGIPTDDAFSMAWAISSHAPGSRLQLQVVRAGKEIHLVGMLGRPTVAGVARQMVPASMARPAASAPIYQYSPADINDQHAYGG